MRAGRVVLDTNLLVAAAYNPASASRRLVEAWVPAGDHTLTWDGRDERGRPVASGAYMARLIGPEGTATVRISLLRPAP